MRKRKELEKGGKMTDRNAGKGRGQQKWHEEEKVFRQRLRKKSRECKAT